MMRHRPTHTYIIVITATIAHIHTPLATAWRAHTSHAQAATPQAHRVCDELI